MNLEFLGINAVAGQPVYGSFIVDDVPIPLVLAAGARPGPTLVIHCAQHPTEYSGSAMIGPLLKDLDLAALRGTVAIVPLCNVPFILRTRIPGCYPRQADSIKSAEGTPRNNINRCWPGRADGTWNDQLAHALSHGLFARADAVLDYHSCRTCDPNFTSYVASSAPSRALALAFGTEAVDEAPVEGHFPGQLHRRVPIEIGTPAILIEMAPTSLRVQWRTVQESLRGATNIMKHLGMLSGKPVLPRRQVVFHRGSEQVSFHARETGFVCFHHPEVDVVKKGDLIAEVRSLKDFSVIETHVAQCDGGLASCGAVESHLVLQGEELATLQPGAEIICNE